MATLNQGYTEYEDQKEEFKEKERTSDLLSLNMERSEVFRFERTWHNASAPPKKYMLYQQPIVMPPYGPL